jgi:hypothetical protein
MKSDFHSKNWPETVERIPKTPAGRALDAKLVNEADLLRLKAITRLHARGLPPPVDSSDLLQEAFTRVLDGSLRQPAGVPVVAFLAEVVRSIKEQYDSFIGVPVVPGSTPRGSDAAHMISNTSIPSSRSPIRNVSAVRLHNCNRLARAPLICRRTFTAFTA